MKKNRFLKVASAMIILCLMTTCAVSTTFAKYTTAGSATDEARVAKWGVELSMVGDTIFANQYEDVTNGITVEATTDVVAPGTSSSEDKAAPAVFAIKGTPEVAVNIKIEFTADKDIYLAAGTYDDETTATVTDDEFTLADNYHPLVFTLKQTADYTGTLGTPVELAKGSLADIETFLNARSTKDYSPNTVLDSTFELSWEWAFESGNDKADTYLANRMADGTSGTFNLEVGYSLTITVTQID